MKEADKSVLDTWDGRLTRGQMMIDAESAPDPSEDISHQVPVSVLAAIEWAHLGGD